MRIISSVCSTKPVIGLKQAKNQNQSHDFNNQQSQVANNIAFGKKIPSNIILLVGMFATVISSSVYFGLKDKNKVNNLQAQIINIEGLSKNQTENYAKNTLQIFRADQNEAENYVKAIKDSVSGVGGVTPSEILSRVKKSTEDVARKVIIVNEGRKIFRH